MAIDWETKKKTEVIHPNNRAKEIILHPLSILVQIFNIIMIYSLSGLRSALAITFFLRAIIMFFILHKQDEEA